ncbi:Uncharacterised protein [Ectopseudomonas mendocina]|uniref:Uncharacterized protein n=1 Tax=Ectopseudomonas mendocina TaxID=300 RepID=A0A379PM70_ECTME|nr:Uncharacterised protein [Pseudomonas mendocina]
MNPVCSHGKKWHETCLDCQEVGLLESIKNAEKRLERDKRLLRAIRSMKKQSTRTKFQCIARGCEGCLICEDKNDQATGNLLHA